MKKRFRIDNSPVRWFFALIIIMLGTYIIYVLRNGMHWGGLFSLFSSFVVILVVTFKELRISDNCFIEIYPLLPFLIKKRRVAIGDIVSIQKIKRNQLRVNKVRGFEVLRVAPEDIDALMATLKAINPRIVILEKR